MQIADGATRAFRIGVYEIVEWLAFLLGGKANVATVSEKDAIGIVSAEEKVALRGILPGLRSVHGNPANTSQIEFRPAMVAADVAFRFSLRKRKADFKARGNARGAHHANEEGMEIGAVAPLGATGPDGVAAAPAFPGLVVAHGGENVVVEVAGFFESGGIARGVFAGQFGDGTVEGNELVGLKVTLEIWFVRRGGRTVTSNPEALCLAVGVNSA